MTFLKVALRWLVNLVARRMEKSPYCCKPEAWSIPPYGWDSVETSASDPDLCIPALPCEDIQLNVQD